MRDRATMGVWIFGRLAPGASLTQVRAEFATISQRVEAAYPQTNKGQVVLPIPYSALATGSLLSRQGNYLLSIFSVITLLTVLIVCANVANLMLARAEARQRELALRQSLGASRARIVRMLLTEGVVVSLVAWMAACGAALASLARWPVCFRRIRRAPRSTPTSRPIGGCRVRDDARGHRDGRVHAGPGHARMAAGGVALAQSRRAQRRARALEAVERARRPAARVLRAPAGLRQARLPLALPHGPTGSRLQDGSPAARHREYGRECHNAICEPPADCAPSRAPAHHSWHRIDLAPHDRSPSGAKPFAAIPRTSPCAQIRTS